ncbi:hypothetical protein MMC22_009493 [Lobaria immixta]|nr:hypothetical protein [Lobaria immixta]
MPQQGTGSDRILPLEFIFESVVRIQVVISGRDLAEYDVITLTAGVGKCWLCVLQRRGEGTGGENPPRRVCRPSSIKGVFALKRPIIRRRLITGPKDPIQEMTLANASKRPGDGSCRKCSKKHLSWAVIFVLCAPVRDSHPEANLGDNDSGHALDGERLVSIDDVHPLPDRTSPRNVGRPEPSISTFVGRALSMAAAVQGNVIELTMLICDWLTTGAKLKDFAHLKKQPLL